MKCVLQTAWIRTEWVETKKVKERKITSCDYAKKNQNKEKKSAKSEDWKIHYIVSARENCCEADCE